MISQWKQRISQSPIAMTNNVNPPKISKLFLSKAKYKFQTRKSFKLRNGKTSMCVQPFNYYTPPNFKTLEVEFTDIQVK